MSVCFFRFSDRRFIRRPDNKQRKTPYLQKTGSTFRQNEKLSPNSLSGSAVLKQRNIAMAVHGVSDYAKSPVLKDLGIGIRNLHLPGDLGKGLSLVKA